MMKSKRKKETKKVNILRRIIRAEIFAVAVTLIIIALVSYLLWQGVFSVDALSIINVVIKAIGALTACIFCALFIPQRRMLFCVLGGVLYIVLSCVVLSLILGHLTINASIFSDLLIGVGAGAVVAVISAKK